MHSPKMKPSRENEIKKKIHTTLNPNNKLITKNEVEKILKKGGVEAEINDLSIWQKAFVHKSYVMKDDKVKKGNITPLQPQSNERLEWLGDAKLQGAISYYLWCRFPDQDEGFLTKLRSKLVKTKNLSFLSTKLGLSPYLLISYHVEFGCQGRTNKKILENTFEAFIGAMFVDFSKKSTSYAYELVRTFIKNVMEEYPDITEMIVNDENYKDQLMWYFQKKFNGAYPIYKEEKYENECFYIYIEEPVSKEVVGRGYARSKKDANQNAAKDALNYYAKKDFKK
jgi:ribonuclease-3